MAERALELVAKAAPYLARHGSDTPRLDAELLLAEALGCSRMEVYLQFERPLSDTERDRFRELLRRRAAGEPVAYIRGRKEFMSLEFLVSPAVLVPRPETEVLVEEGLSRLSTALDRGVATPWVLDVGTGSGAIVISLLAQSPGTRAVGTDISAAALDVARANAARLGVGDRVEWLEADLATGVDRRFDLLTANLPYVDPAWEDGVTPDVAASEPGQALFAADGGLELVSRLLGELPRLLRPGASALLEVDPRNAGEALRRAQAVGAASLVQDLAGRDRVLVVASRS
jgi:release factor glutamine methyltransferase